MQTLCFCDIVCSVLFPLLVKLLRTTGHRIVWKRHFRRDASQSYTSVYQAACKNSYMNCFVVLGELCQIWKESFIYPFNTLRECASSFFAPCSYKLLRKRSMMGWSGVNRPGKWFKGWLLGLTCWHLLCLTWWFQIGEKVFPFIKSNSYFKTTKLPIQSHRFVCSYVIPCLFSLSCRLIAWTSLWTRVSLLLQVSRQGQRPAWRFALNLISWGKWEASSNCPHA